jgi:endonuclease/exonuclease/phosphatase family metal-dependent hydrolase
MLGVVRAVRVWLVLFVVVGSIVLGDQWSATPGPDQPGTDQPSAGEPETPSAEPPSAQGPSEEALRCEAELRERGPRKTPGRPRIGTWNVRWFPRGSAKGKDPSRRTDVRWLACAIAALDLDVLALQELLDTPDGRRARLDLLERLDALTGSPWHAELDECASGNQHVAFLWDERRVQLKGVRSLAALNPHGKACAAGLRPGLHASARFASGETLQLIALHLDSGEKERDHTNRARSVEALEGVLGRGAKAIVLGDYNTMGCATCAPPISAGAELDALEARLGRGGLARVEPASARACSHYYERRPTLLDHAVVTRALLPRAKLETHGACARLRCERPKRGARVPEWRTLSDHCPLVVELAPLKLGTRGQASGR